MSSANATSLAWKSVMGYPTINESNKQIYRYANFYCTKFIDFPPNTLSFMSLKYIISN